MVSEGAGFSIRMTDMAPAEARGRVRIDACQFRSDNAVEGATAPFQGGVAIGLDIDVTNTVFRAPPSDRTATSFEDRAARTGMDGEQWWARPFVIYRLHI